MYKKLIFVMVLLFLTVIMSFNVMSHSGNTDNYGGHYILEGNKTLGYHYHSGDYAGWKVNINPERKKVNVKKCLVSENRENHLYLTDLKVINNMPGKYVYNIDDWSYDYNLITCKNVEIKIKNQMEICKQISKPDKTVKISEAGKYFYRNNIKTGEEIPIEYALYLGLYPDKSQFSGYWAICKKNANVLKNKFLYDEKVRISIDGNVFHSINNKSCNIESTKLINLVLVYVKGYKQCNTCFIAPTISPIPSITNTIIPSPTNTIQNITKSPEGTSTVIQSLKPGELPETGEGSSIFISLIGFFIAGVGFVGFKYKDKIIKD